MNDLIQLTDAEIAGVSGGILNQNISISATQSNGATVTQTANSTNNGSVSASLSSNGGGGGAWRCRRRRGRRWLDRSRVRLFVKQFFVGGPEELHLSEQPPIFPSPLLIT